MWTPITSTLNNSLVNDAQQQMFSPPPPNAAVANASGASISNHSCPDGPIQVSDPESTVAVTRLRSLASCVFCNKLSRGGVYHCKENHTICEACLIHAVVSDNLFKRETRCPTCCSIVNFSECTRNGILTELMQEFPDKCELCGQFVLIGQLKEHQKAFCRKRIINCKCRALGCDWEGHAEQLAQHMSVCIPGNMQGKDLLHWVNERQRTDPKRLLLGKVTALLSKRDLAVIDLDLNLKYEDDLRRFQSDGFNIFSHTFVVTAVAYPIAFQLKLVQKIRERLHLKFFVILGPKPELQSEIVACVNEVITGDFFPKSVLQYPAPEWEKLMCNKVMKVRVIMARLNECGGVLV